jgi:WD40 repeat protein
MLWDVASARRVMQFKGHLGPVNAVAISSDGTFAATGGGDAHVFLWDIFTGRKLAEIKCGDSPVTSLTISHDCAQILAGNKDGSARLLDLAGNETLFYLEGNGEEVASCAFTGDGKRLVTASMDGRICFWDSSDGKLLATLHHLADGFLWTTPPDEAAPSGWFWTNRPELISVLRSGMEGEVPVPLSHDDPNCSAYLDSGMFNRQDLAMARLNDFPAYRKEIDRIVGRITDRQLGWELNRRPALPSKDNQN